MTVYYPEGWLQHTENTQHTLFDLNFLEEARKKQQILEARAILCDSKHNLHVDLGDYVGVIPRSEGAVGIQEGTVRDIALISRVNRPVCFTVESIDIEDEKPKIILSRRKAQEKCLREYIQYLQPGDIIDARITHLEQFGAFADIGCGIISLIPIDSVSVSRISHPAERFENDMDVKVVIKNRMDGRITLSHKELLGTWEENVADFAPGETVTGIVRSIESYGIFVELTPNLAGLAENRPDIKPGSQVSVYIKSIIPEKMKIKLIIIDSFDIPHLRQKPRYYYSEKHMDTFFYSPKESPRQIFTDFTLDSL